MRLRERHGRNELTVYGKSRTVAKKNVLYVFKKFLALATTAGLDPDTAVKVGPGAFNEYVKECTHTISRT